MDMVRHPSDAPDINITFFKEIEKICVELVFIFLTYHSLSAIASQYDVVA